jgi:hypothetical protein
MMRMTSAEPQTPHKNESNDRNDVCEAFGNDDRSCPRNLDAMCLLQNGALEHLTDLSGRYSQHKSGKEDEEALELWHASDR